MYIWFRYTHSLCVYCRFYFRYIYNHLLWWLLLLNVCRWCFVFLPLALYRLFSTFAQSWRALPACFFSLCSCYSYVLIWLLLLLYASTHYCMQYLQFCVGFFPLIVLFWFTLCVCLFVIILRTRCEVVFSIFLVEVRTRHSNTLLLLHYIQVKFIE